MSNDKELLGELKDGSDIAVETPPYDTSISYEINLILGETFPQWNGLRIKSPGRPEIYLVDRGVKRHIPNPPTFNNLFRNWSYNEVIDIDAIATGLPITSGAVLARASGTAPIYLIDNNMKRHVTSPAVMDKYNFNWGRVYQLPLSVIQSMPEGDSIN